MVSVAPSRSGTCLAGPRTSIEYNAKDLRTKVKPGSIASSDSSDWHTLSFLETKASKCDKFKQFLFGFSFFFLGFRMHVVVFESKFPDIFCNWILFDRGNDPCACEARRVRVYLFSFSLPSPTNIFPFLERCLCRIKNWKRIRGILSLPQNTRTSKGRWKWRTACNLCQIW